MDINRYNLRRSDLRHGDEVYFYHRDARIEGVVEKVNARSVHVRQTNDECYVTRAAFGNRGGRRKGGRGCMWNIPVNKHTDQTPLSFTFDGLKSAEENSARVTMMVRHQAQVDRQLAKTYVEYVLQHVDADTVLELLEEIVQEGK